ncbi:MAG TPA: ABC transporter ATP-binding protein [Chloroflexota bacterium]
MAEPRDLPPIYVDGITRRFGDFTAVDSISMEVPPGTILGLIGPSGSGKTTIIRMLNGTLKPTSGEVRVLGEVPTRFHRSVRERIGYVPQHFELYEELTAAENVSFVASLFGVLWPGRSKRVRRVLQMLDLWEVRHRRARSLSGGMQRRLSLASALVHSPDLFFIDEPTAGIDPILRQTIWEEFRNLRDEGRTLLVTTQYVGEAEHCDLVALIAGGRLIALDQPDRLRQEALGGDVIEIRTARAFDGAVLADVQGVKDVRQDNPRRLLVTAEQAGTTTPRLLQAVSAQGGEVVSSSEYHPTFDEVFTELVTRTQNGGEVSAEDFTADRRRDHAA